MLFMLHLQYIIIHDTMAEHHSSKLCLKKNNIGTLYIFLIIDNFIFFPSKE